MSKWSPVVVGVIAALLAACAADTQPRQNSGGSAERPPFVYPAQGQTAEQQSRDEFECFQWASEQTGFDPTQPVAVAQTGGAGNVAGSAAVGAGFGAVGGALVGGLFGQPRRGAAIGAGSGALFGGAQASGQQQQQRRAQQDAQQQQAEARDSYFRAFATCMTGRGYTVT